MTVPANPRRDRYAASAGQTVFPYTFRVFAAGDLLVERVRAGVTTTLTLTTDYTVSGVGNDAGGNVTLTAPSLAGDVLAIVSAQPDQRTTDFTESGDFRAAAVNAEFDRIWIGIQQLQQELRRQLTAPVSDAIGLSYRLPLQAERAGKLLGFDGTGQPTLATGASIGGVSISNFGSQIISAAAGEIVRGLIGAASPAEVSASITAAVAAEAAARAAAIAALPFTEYAESPEITIVNDGPWLFKHELSGLPRLVEAVLVCKTAQFGIAVNEEMNIGLRSPTPVVMPIVSNATHVRGVVPDTGFLIYRLDGPGAGTGVITNANFRLKVRAWR